jgi:hypothetical protein
MPVTASSWPICRALLTLVMVGMLAACSRPTLPFQSVDPTTAHIQQTLDRYVQAYNQNDTQLLLQLVEPSNLPFRRFFQARFTDFQSSSQRHYSLESLQVVSAQQRSAGFILAHIQAGNGAAADWLFHQSGTDWLFAEPTVSEIGTPKRTVQGRFTFVTYPWADDVNSTIISLVEHAQQQVVSELGQDAQQPVTIDIKPIYGLSPFENATYVAYYTPGLGQNGPDRIEVYTPNSYLFGYYDSQLGWQQKLQTILTHEYTHMVHTRAFKNAGYRTTWMPEGLAEYVARASYRDMVHQALHDGTIIPIIDQQSVVYSTRVEFGHHETTESSRRRAFPIRCGAPDGHWSGSSPMRLETRQRSHNSANTNIPCAPIARAARSG